MSVNCSFLSLPKCKPSVVGVLIFLFLISAQLTVSVCLLAQGIILFPISCTYPERCAHNIYVCISLVIPVPGACVLCVSVAYATPQEILTAELGRPDS